MQELQIEQPHNDSPMQASGNYIGGAWKASLTGGTYIKTNPMRPSERVGEHALSDAADAAAAVRAARSAFVDWAHQPMARRATYLETAAAALSSRAEHVARTMSLEMG